MSKGKKCVQKFQQDSLDTISLPTVVWLFGVRSRAICISEIILLCSARSETTPEFFWQESGQQEHNTGSEALVQCKGISKWSCVKISQIKTSQISHHFYKNKEKTPTQQSFLVQSPAKVVFGVKGGSCVIAEMRECLHPWASCDGSSGHPDSSAHAYSLAQQWICESVNLFCALP